MSELARVGGPLGCVGLAVLIVAGRRELRLAGLVAWALGTLLLVSYVVPAGHHRLLAAAGVAGLAGTVVAAAIFRRWPWLIAIGTLGLTPARIPVTVGGTDANLLLPLYGVVTGAALLLAWEFLRGEARARELGSLSWPLAAFLAWTGLSLAWTRDLHEGAIALLAFYLPFGLLALAIARLPWSRRWLSVLYAELVLMALLFAGVGVYQWATRDVFFNPKVIVDNAYAPQLLFRVNSVFYDPSIYGRFLVVAILASLALVLRGRAGRVAIAAGAAIVLTWVGLFFSFSQSSFAALIVGVLVLAAISWRWRAAAAAALVGAVVLAVGFSAPQVRHTLFRHSSAGLNHASSDRFKLVSNGTRIAAAHPAIGVGVGSFKRAYADRLGLHGRDPKKAASHDTPVTVAAETGIVGLLLFAWLVAAALASPLRRLPRSFEGLACLIVGVTLAAIAVHSLFYNDFFEDPMVWGLFGLAGLATERRLG